MRPARHRCRLQRRRQLTALAIAVGLFGVLVALRYAPIGRAHGGGRRRRRHLGRDVRVGRPPDHRRAGDRPRDQRLSAGARRPRARDRAFRAFREQPTPELARTARLDAVLGDLGQRAPAVPPPPVDQLRDRPALRARQRRGHLQGELLGDALARRSRSASSSATCSASPSASSALVAGDAPRVRWPAPRSAGRGSPHGRRGRHRLHGVAADRELAFAASCSTRRSSASSPPRSSRRFGVGRLPRHGAIPRRDARATARAAPPTRCSTSPTRSIPSATTSAARGCARDPARVRRLRVPVLRSRRDRHPRAAGPFGGELRFVFRHLPLNDVHPRARRRRGGRGRRRPGQLLGDARPAARPPGRAARDASCATPRSSASTSTASATSVRDRASRAARRRDVESADASGVSGTPTFFINGRRHYGAYDIETLTAEVRAARGALSTGQSSKRR